MSHLSSAMDKQQIAAAYKEHQALKKLQPFDSVPEAVKSSTNPDSVPMEYRSYLGRCVDFTLKRFWTVFFGEQFGTIKYIAKPRFFQQALLMSQKLHEAREWVARIDQGDEVFAFSTFRKFAEPFYAADFVDEALRNELSCLQQNDGYDGDDCSETLYVIASKWSGQPLTDALDYKWKDILNESDPNFDFNLILAVKEMHRRYFVFGLLDMPEEFYLRANLEVSKRSGIRAEVIYLAADLCRTYTNKKRAGMPQTVSRASFESGLLSRLEALKGPEPSLLGQLEVLYGSLEVGDAQTKEEEKEDKNEAVVPEEDDSKAWNVQGTPFTEDPVEYEEEEEEYEESDEEEVDSDEDSEDDDEDRNWGYPDEGPIKATRSLLDEPLHQVEKRKLGAELLAMLDGVKKNIVEIRVGRVKAAPVQRKQPEQDGQKPTGIESFFSKMFGR